VLGGRHRLQVTALEREQVRAAQGRERQPDQEDGEDQADAPLGQARGAGPRGSSGRAALRTPRGSCASLGGRPPLCGRALRRGSPGGQD
jgi:hypothetical protein